MHVVYRWDIPDFLNLSVNDPPYNHYVTLDFAVIQTNSLLAVNNNQFVSDRLNGNNVRFEAATCNHLEFRKERNDPLAANMITVKFWQKRVKEMEYNVFRENDWVPRVKTLQDFNVRVLLAHVCK